MTRPLNLPRADVARPASSDAAVLSISLDRRRSVPLNVQLGEQLRALILSGRLAAGGRVPSSRQLAGDLGVSRATVVLAYDQLTSEGYLEGRHGSGMYVVTALPDNVLEIGPDERPRALPHRGSSPLPSQRHRPPDAEPARPFRLGTTDPTQFPFQHWSRLLYRTWRNPSEALVAPPDAFGWLPLRAAIAHHLAAWRGIASEAAQIVVTSGTADAIDVVASTALVPGAHAIVEDPGYPALRHALEAAGVVVQPARVDADGISVESVLPTSDARAVFVTPSRQFPLGATLPLRRRLALLDWAAASGGYVVEDDFDSEYRYAGTPLPALMSLDRRGRAIYIGSFSKVLSGALRLGFVVLPEGLIGAAQTHLAHRGILASLIAQPALAELIASGEYAAHIRRTRRVYARRLTAVLDEQAVLDGLATLQPTDAGMHVVAHLCDRLAARLTDRQAAAAARATGIVTAPLSDFAILPQARPALLLGFAGFSEPLLRRGMHRLAGALRDA